MCLYVTGWQALLHVREQAGPGFQRMYMMAVALTAAYEGTSDAWATSATGWRGWGGGSLRAEQTEAPLSPLPARPLCLSSQRAVDGSGVERGRGLARGGARWREGVWQSAAT